MSEKLSVDLSGNNVKLFTYKGEGITKYTYNYEKSRVVQLSP